MYPNPRRIVPAFVPDLRFWKGSSVAGMGVGGGLKGVDTINVDLVRLFGGGVVMGEEVEERRIVRERGCRVRRRGRNCRRRGLVSRLLRGGDIACVVNCWRI